MKIEAREKTIKIFVKKKSEVSLSGLIPILEFVTEIYI